MNDKPVGMSAAERDVRERIARFEAKGLDSFPPLVVPLAVLRDLLRDLDMWREISTNEIDKWSFDALVAMAKRLLDEVYPVSIFPAEPHELLLRQVQMRDSGPMFVFLLRELIAAIENRPQRKGPPP